MERQLTHQSRGVSIAQDVEVRLRPALRVLDEWPPVVHAVGLRGFERVLILHGCHWKSGTFWVIENRRSQHSVESRRLFFCIEPDYSSYRIA